MKNFIAACAKELTSPLTTHVAAASLGAVFVTLAHLKMLDNGRTLCLPQEAFDGLVTGEEPIVIFESNKHNHVFHVTLQK